MQPPPDRLSTIADRHELNGTTLCSAVRALRLAVNSQHGKELVLRATTIFCCSVAVLCGAPLVASAQSLIVDGQFDEWSAATMIATDPAGDAAGAFDITEVHAASQGSELFMHFNTTTVLNLLGGRSGELLGALVTQLPF